MAARKTPVMQQHAAAKRAYPDAILFFRLGDFYEMFEEDAVLCARVLDLTLTSRNKGKPDEIPMAGVPHHAAHGYIGRLLDAGYKVALCEQMADPSTVKGIVPREVVRVLTPGTVTSGEHLSPESNNWLGVLDVMPDRVGVALLDLSTGELRAAELGNVAAALAELGRAAPKEVLIGSDGDPAATDVLAAASVALDKERVRDDRALDPDTLERTEVPLAAEARALGPAVERAVARALRYARACNPGKDIPVRRIVRWDPSSTLVIDAVAQAHLELVASPLGGKKATLLSVVDSTCTAPAARRLRQRLLTPLTDVGAIRRRLDAVELFVIHPALRSDFRRALGGVGDLERLAIRAAFGEATPRDLGALRDGLIAAEGAVGLLEALDDAAQREVLGLGSDPLDTVRDVAAELDRALVERPPAQQKEGAVFRSGYDAALDESAELKQRGAEHMVALEARLRETTEIPTLKVRYTRVFGWYVEVSRTHVSRAPSSWRRKQTVASGERFTLDELDELADRITQAEERHRVRELELMAELVERVRGASDRITTLAEVLADWDIAASLADVAHRYDYCRPVVDGSGHLELSDARHPVVERLAAEGRFVPNDVALSIDTERLWLVTGPNMAGKSTLLRQTALCIILAQMGSFVPARAARVGVVDRILSRVGASDNVARGESTFMVEMRETAEILRSATARSLVIVDEIGRGTSTFDGLAIAWSVAEYLDSQVGCRALFATHYHELTALGESSEHAQNVSVSAQELDGDVVFLHRLIRAPASRSYGIAVAKLAGLPEVVLARARNLLLKLESTSAPTDGDLPQRKARGGTPQLELFAPAPALPDGAREALELLDSVEVERITPLEALQFLARLKQQLRSPSK